jgi:hypothetical protein
MSRCKWTAVVQGQLLTLPSGATFIILAKDKTWWIVQKDPDGAGLVVPDVTKSGWVPSGRSVPSWARS